VQLLPLTIIMVALIVFTLVFETCLHRLDHRVSQFQGAIALFVLVWVAISADRWLRSHSLFAHAEQGLQGS
jgi:predicted ferric reductase